MPRHRRHRRDSGSAPPPAAAPGALRPRSPSVSAASPRRKRRRGRTRSPPLPASGRKRRRRRSRTRSPPYPASGGGVGSPPAAAGEQLQHGRAPAEDGDPGSQQGPLPAMPAGTLATRRSTAPQSGAELLAALGHVMQQQHRGAALPFQQSAPLLPPGAAPLPLCPPGGAASAYAQAFAAGASFQLQLQLLQQPQLAPAPQHQLQLPLSGIPLGLQPAVPPAATGQFVLLQPVAPMQMIPAAPAAAAQAAVGAPQQGAAGHLPPATLQSARPLSHAPLLCELLPCGTAAAASVRIDRIPVDVSSQALVAALNHDLPPRMTQKVVAIDARRHPESQTHSAFASLACPAPEEQTIITIQHRYGKCTMFNPGMAHPQVAIQAVRVQRLAQLRPATPIPDPPVGSMLQLRMYARRQGWTRHVLRILQPGVLALLELAARYSTQAIAGIAVSQLADARVHSSVLFCEALIVLKAVNCAATFRQTVHDARVCWYGCDFLLTCEFMGPAERGGEVGIGSGGDQPAGPAPLPAAGAGSQDAHTADAQFARARRLATDFLSSAIGELQSVPKLSDLFEFSVPIVAGGVGGAVGAVQPAAATLVAPPDRIVSGECVTADSGSGDKEPRPPVPRAAAAAGAEPAGCGALVVVDDDGEEDHSAPAPVFPPPAVAAGVSTADGLPELAGAELSGGGSDRESVPAGVSAGTDAARALSEECRDEREKFIFVLKQSAEYASYCAQVPPEQRDPRNPLHIGTPRASQCRSDSEWDAAVAGFCDVLVHHHAARCEASGSGVMPNPLDDSSDAPARRAAQP
eukprot:TRINITY_DN16979_c1_g1_i1.p1 TRINITY_DN16979_c1_g1~~TRINITY_DN16979_c1_g1_i1.p1  ORF type:complete len:825 (+),score=168.18 TRINITY_DN16979_c1_g1_i1:68-2476(+)